MNMSCNVTGGVDPNHNLMPGAFGHWTSAESEMTTSPTHLAVDGMSTQVGVETRARATVSTDSNVGLGGMDVDVDAPRGAVTTGTMLNPSAALQLVESNNGTSFVRTYYPDLLQRFPPPSPVSEYTPGSESFHGCNVEDIFDVYNTGNVSTGTDSASSGTVTPLTPDSLEQGHLDHVVTGVPDVTPTLTVQYSSPFFLSWAESPDFLGDITARRNELLDDSSSDGWTTDDDDLPQLQAKSDGFLKRAPRSRVDGYPIPQFSEPVMPYERDDEIESDFEMDALIDEALAKDFLIDKCGATDTFFNFVASITTSISSAYVYSQAYLGQKVSWRWYHTILAEVLRKSADHNTHDDNSLSIVFGPALKTPAISLFDDIIRLIITFAVSNGSVTAFAVTLVNFAVERARAADPLKPRVMDPFILRGVTAIMSTQFAALQLREYFSKSDKAAIAQLQSGADIGAIFSAATKIGKNPMWARIAVGVSAVVALLAVAGRGTSQDQVQAAAEVMDRMTGAFRKTSTFADICGCIYETVDVASKCLRDGSLDPLLFYRSKSNQWYLDAASFTECIIHYESVQVTSMYALDLQAKYRDLQARYRAIIASSVSGSKEIVQIEKAYKTLVNTYQALVGKIRSSASRKAPFAVLLVGPPGCGKSVLTRTINRWVCSLEKVPVNDSYMWTCTGESKYCDGLSNDIKTVLIDDIGKTKPGKAPQDNTLVNIIGINNNTAFIANMAAVEDKGCVVPAPTCLLGTTNVRDMNAPHWYSRPAAIYRRFPFVVQLEPKEEVCGLDSTGKPIFRIDPDRVGQPARGEYANTCYYHVFRVETPSDHEYHDVPVAVFSTLVELNRWFVREYRKHHDQQEKVISMVGSYDICPVCHIGRHGDRCDCDVAEDRDAGSVAASSLESVGYEEPSVEFEPRSDSDVASADCDEFDSEEMTDDEAKTLGRSPQLQVGEQGADEEVVVVDEDRDEPVIVTLVTWAYLFALFLWQCACGALFTVRLYIPVFWVYIIFILYPNDLPGWFDSSVRVVKRIHPYPGIFCAGVQYNVVRRYASRWLEQAGGWRKWAEDNQTAIRRTAYATGGLVTLAAFGAYARRLCRRAAAQQQAGEPAAQQCEPTLASRVQALGFDGSTATVMPNGTVAALVTSQHGSAYRTVPFVGRSVQVAPNAAHTTTAEDALRLYQNACLIATIELFEDDERTIRIGSKMYQSILCLRQNMWITTSHFLPERSCVVVISVNNGATSNPTILSSDQIIRHKTADLAILTLSGNSARGRTLVDAKRDFLYSGPITHGMKATYIRPAMSGMVGMGHRLESGRIVLGEEHVKDWPTRGTNGTSLWTQTNIVTTGVRTDPGDCGSVLLIECVRGDKKHLHIGGLHQAGLDDKAIAVRLDRAMIEEMIAGVCAKNGGVADVDRIIPALQLGVTHTDLINTHYHDCDPMLGEGHRLGDLNPHNPTLWMPGKSTKAQQFGELLRADGLRYDTGAGSKSKVINMPFRPFFEAEGLTTDKVAPVLTGSKVKQTAVAKAKSEPSGFCDKFNEDVAQCVLDEVIRELRDQGTGRECRPLTFGEAINGVDGVAFIDPMNLKTSAGYPYNCPKSKIMLLDPNGHDHRLPQDVLTRIGRAVGAYKRGEKAGFVFKAIFKDEPRSVEKVRLHKTRAIFGSPIEATVLCRQYFSAVIAMLQRRRGQAYPNCPGVNAEGPDWKGLYEFMFDKCFDSDYADYDFSVLNAKNMRIAFAHVIYLAITFGDFTAEDVAVMLGFAQDVTCCYVDFFGDLMRWLGVNPSGQGCTTLVNGIVNRQNVCCTFVKVRATRFGPEPLRVSVSIFFKVCRLLTYGDDLVVSILTGHEYFNFKTFRDYMARVGISITPALKNEADYELKDKAQVDFLKRRFVVGPDGNVRSPIRSEVLEKIGCVGMRSSESDDVHMASVLASMHRLCAQCDEVEFNRWDDMIKRCCDVHLLWANIPYKSGRFPTYAEYTEHCYGSKQIDIGEQVVDLPDHAYLE